MGNRDAERRGGGWLIEAAEAGEVFTPEDLTADQLAMARAAAQFVEREVLPRGAAIEAQDWPLTRRLLEQAGELGLLALDVPAEYGGLELDAATCGLVSEQIGRQASFAVSHGAHAGIGTLPLVYFGTPEQKRRYLPSLAAGTRIGAFALSEADYGSDALGAATRARLDESGTHYVLNGTKMWTSNGGFADLFTLFAQVELPGGAPEGARTFSAFLVERDFPGVSFGREEHKLGIRGSSTCRVILDDARVPVENLLHQVGRGHVVALNVLNAGRLKLALGLLGPAKELLAVSARYANERRQMGRPISRFGLVAEKLAEQAVRLYAAESACYRVCGLVEGFGGGAAEGLPPRARALEEFLVECAMMKVQASEMLDHAADEAVQIHGGYGYTEEFPVARAYRDARINRIFEGTNEINRLTIAGTLFRRAESGRLGLLEAARRAQEELLSGAAADPGAGPMGPELAAVAGAKKLALAAAGAAAREAGAALPEQQEILGRLADMAIDLFSAESAALRAAKMRMRAADDRSALAEQMARIVVEDAVARVEGGARRVLAALAQGDDLRGRLALLRRFTRRLPADTIGLRRAVAARVIAAERYPLARFG